MFQGLLTKLNSKKILFSNLLLSTIILFLAILSSCEKRLDPIKEILRDTTIISKLDTVIHKEVITVYDTIIEQGKDSVTVIETELIVEKIIEKEVIVRDTTTVEVEKEVIVRDTTTVEVEKEVIVRDTTTVEVEKEVIVRDTTIVEIEKEVIVRDTLVVVNTDTVKYIVHDTVRFTEVKTVFDTVYLENEVSVVIPSHLTFREKIDLLPGMKIEAERYFSGKYYYELRFLQPLNHENLKGASFEQRLYVHFNGDESAVTEMVTAGYSTSISEMNRTFLAQSLNCNQVLVEFRFFGESVPHANVHDWDYLNNTQQMHDYHRIRQYLGSVLNGKWAASGVSKGGGNALNYKYLYPEDVELTIANVAPIILAREDKRTDKFLTEEVGNQACRDKLEAFQRLALEKKSEVLPYFRDWANKYGKSFNRVGLGVAYEYAVLEYSFTFWQWANGVQDCAGVPSSNASAVDILNHILSKNIVTLYEDTWLAENEAFFYQNQTEIGYYGFVTEHLKDLLVEVKDPDNALFAPQNATLNYDGTNMKELSDWLVNEGNDILYIYGELDTWTSCGVEPSPSTNAKRYVLPNGSHGARIGDFDANRRNEIYNYLNSRLSTQIGN